RESRLYRDRALWRTARCLCFLIVAKHEIDIDKYPERLCRCKVTAPSDGTTPIKKNADFNFGRPRMRDWQGYWNEAPKQYGETEFLKQVDKTVGGEPVSDAVVNDIVSSIVEKLSIGTEDRVLDLCCGNGLLSSSVSRQCAEVVGVDVSAVLIALARKYHR